MSITPISNNSTTFSQINIETYESFKQQYNAYKADWENISSSESFTQNEPYLSKIKEKIEELLEQLDNVVEDGYDEEIVKDAMQALGSLLKGSSTTMSLEVRLACLEKLLEALTNGKITSEDAESIIANINNAENEYTEADFKKEYFTAFINQAFNKGYISSSDKNSILSKIEDSTEYSEEDFNKDYHIALIKNKFPDIEITGEESLEEIKEIYYSNIANADIEKSKAISDEVKSKNATTSASLALKVIQANHQFKELDLENISDEKKERDAQKNSMIKKLKNEGIWQENTIDRHLEMIEQERINELRKSR